MGQLKLVEATFLFSSSINSGTTSGQDMTGTQCLINTVTEREDCISGTVGDTVENGSMFQLTASQILAEPSTSGLRILPSTTWVVLMRFFVKITNGNSSELRVNIYNWVSAIL